MRWQLRLLFIALMVAGLGWIYLGNYVRIGKTLLEYGPVETAVFWGGVLVIGLLLDAGAGLHLRPFFAVLNRGASCTPAEVQEAAVRAIRFPERASLLLLGSSLFTIALHRALLYMGRWESVLASPEIRSRLLNSIARDLVLTLALSLLLFIFSRRVLKPAVELLGLREMRSGRRFPVGLRLALVVIALGIFNVTMLFSAPSGVPPGRLALYYLLPICMTALVAYLVATDIGRDLGAIGGRLRALSTGVRPDLYHRFAVTESDEVGDLVASINLLQDRVEREFLAFERDLEAARSIQQGLLPRSWSPPPGWDLAGTLLPVQEVGGDFYDLIDLGPGRFGMALGDASGKGLPAALLMASTVSLIRSHAPLHERPGAVLEAVNRLLSASLPPLNFVTAVYAVVDTDRQEVVVASAGHLPPWINGQEAEILPALPLGIEPSVRYAERTYPLRPGSPLLLFSDGLIEAADQSGGLPAPDRFAAELRKGSRPAGEIMQGVLQALNDHLGGLAPADDVTLLVLVPPRAQRLELPSQHGMELKAAEEAARFARENGLPDRAEDMATAVGEACLNAIAHGNALREGASVTIWFRAEPGWIEATVADEGPLFEPPPCAPDLERQMNADDPISGWGLHLMRSTADLVQIEPLPTGKQIRLRFGGESHAD